MKIKKKQADSLKSLIDWLNIKLEKSKKKTEIEKETFNWLDNKIAAPSSATQAISFHYNFSKQLLNSIKERHFW